MPYSANDIADYLLSRTRDEEEGLTNLKLQKLLYYAQGFYMALHQGMKLFTEPLYAWAHGPVVLDVYHRFKEFGRSELPPPDSAPQLDADAEALLDEVWQAYGQFSAWRLREMTHREPPWQNTPQSRRIPDEEMSAYFATQIVEA